ncbi:DUF3307 domain-containing protein [Anaerolineales bacterium HSG24]|nr:DUF3307 domain-containing protein [Anaerolineales bacterium HSG24]
MTLFERGFVAHLVADWLLQNDWMAQYKSDLRHPAAWVHVGIQTLFLAVALGWRAGLILGSIHMLIDTRVPLRWWQRTFRQTNEGPAALHVAIWGDQVVHIAAIALWVFFAKKSYKE